MFMFMFDTLKSDTTAESRYQWELRNLGKLCYLKKLTPRSMILELIWCGEEGTDSFLYLKCLLLSTIFSCLLSLTHSFHVIQVFRIKLCNSFYRKDFSLEHHNGTQRYWCPCFSRQALTVLFHITVLSW